MILVYGHASWPLESQPSVLPVDRCERLWDCTVEKRKCCLLPSGENHITHVIVSFLT